MLSTETFITPNAQLGFGEEACAKEIQVASQQGHALAFNIPWASVYTPLSEDRGPCLLASGGCCEGTMRYDQTLST